MDINYNKPQYTAIMALLQAKFGSRLTTIGKIADVICGPFGSAIKNSDYQDRGIPLVRITNIAKTGYMNYSDLIYISENLGNKLSRTQVTAGDIVISQRGSLGQCAVVDDKFDKLNISANIIAVKNFRGISAKFVHDYILSSIGQSLLERSTSGQVQQKITTADIADLPIPLHSAEEKLTSILQTSYNEYQQKVQQAKMLLLGLNDFILSSLALDSIHYSDKLCTGVFLREVMQHSLGVEFFHPERLTAVRVLQNCKGSTVKKLVDLVTFCRDSVSPIGRKEKYLGLAGVESQTGELSGIEETAAGNAFLYRKGDILYGRLRPYLNKVLFAEDSGLCSTEFYVMRVKERTELLPEYLSAILRSSLIVAQTKHMMTGNTHPRIAFEDVKNLYVPIPEIGVQQQIVDEIYKRRVQARILMQHAEQEWQAAKEQFEKELLGESYEQKTH